MAWGDAATWVGSGIAVVSAVAAFWQSRGAKAAKVQAAISAAEAAVDAKRTADASERLASAQEETSALMRAAAESNATRWNVEHDRGDTWLVRNETGRMAFGVLLASPPENHLINRFTDEPEDIAPGAAITCFAMATSATSDRRVTVTWYATPEKTGAPLTFRFSLPHSGRR